MWPFFFFLDDSYIILDQPLTLISCSFNLVRYVYHNIDLGAPSPKIDQAPHPSTHPSLHPREAAWINIISDDVCWEEKQVASFPAYSEDVSIFINHPQAVELLHHEAAKFLKGMTGGAVPTTEILPKLQVSSLFRGSTSFLLVFFFQRRAA